jgi:LPXTG-site transpeptidase (sortase) family protein
VEEDGVHGVTSNPTIFDKAIAAGTAYDDALRLLLAADPDRDALTLFEKLEVEDLQMAADVLRPVYDPGRMEDSVRPEYSGNSVLVAHRDTFFSHLDELQEGNEIYLWRQGEVYRFEVAGRRVVEPTDLSVLRQSPSPQLTLITCYSRHTMLDQHRRGWWS